MPIPILMPALSPTMEEGALVKWLVREGDEVKAGDIIAEIETDKATMEVEAADDGRIERIVVPEGTEGVAVNTPIAILLPTSGGAPDSGYRPDSLQPSPQGRSAPEQAGAPPHQHPQRGPQRGLDSSRPDSLQPSPQPASGGRPDSGPQRGPDSGYRPDSQQPSPQGRSAPEQAGAPPHRHPQRGPDSGPRRGSDSSPPDSQQLSPQRGPDSGPPDSQRPVPRVSPLARRLAAQAGVDLAALVGSGPRGRIIARDVTAAGVAAAQTQPAAHAAGSWRPHLFFAPGSYDEEPITPMRASIARRLTGSVREIPHFYVTVDCRMDALLRARADINADRGETEARISINDIIVRASALALRDVPDVNVSWGGDVLLRHRHADIGVAVALEGGLITPIVRAAEDKGLAAISAEIREMAERARRRALKPAEYEGGTFAVSNLGMYGVREFTGVINPPHAALLTVGAVRLQVVPADPAPGASRPPRPVTARMMSATLSCDHRIIDGALGARFLQVFRGFMERPATMLL